MVSTPFPHLDGNDVTPSRFCPGRENHEKNDDHKINRGSFGEHLGDIKYILKCSLIFPDVIFVDFREVEN